MNIWQKWNSISLVKRILVGLVIGAVCGLLIAEFYERKGDKKHDGAA